MTTGAEDGPEASVGSAVPVPAAAPVPAARPVFPESDRAAIAALIDESLRSGSLTLGPVTARFEEGFARRHQASHAVAVASGTAAVEIAVRTLGCEGGEVIVPTNTFYATAGAVVKAGGRPRLADVDPATLALSVATLEEAVTSGTVGVVLVHIAGLITPEADAIRSWCEARGLWLAEDAAHAHGSALGGRPAGSFGRVAAFSFYPTKVITSGEGGMLTTAEEGIAEEARIYRDQGKAGFLGGDHVRMGYAWRLSELHAAVGLTQLARLDEFMAVRQRAAAVYDERLADVAGITPLVIPAQCVTNYYKYVAYLDPGVDRGELKARLRAEWGVSLSGEVYARPLHDQPVFADLAGVRDRAFPVADLVCDRQVCLPVHSDLTVGEAERVADAVTAVLAGLRVGS